MFASKTGFVPAPIYHFIELSWAIIDMKGFKEFARYNPRLSILPGRYFPFLWNGSTRYIAVDIDPAGHNRVVTIEINEEEQEPLREAYYSFEEFLKDAIRANENDEPLSCLRTLGKPITQVSGILLNSTVKTISKSGKAARLSELGNPLVLRVDFSEGAKWKSLYKTLQGAQDEFNSSLSFVNDPEFDGFEAGDLASLVSESSSQAFAFIVDRTALTKSGNPVLVIDLHHKPGRTFRVIASEFGSVANNLSIANMDFDDFVKAVDKDGIYRGKWMKQNTPVTSTSTKRGK
jgi:hypothetical protein